MGTHVVRGAFNGFNGDAVFEMDDGSFWKQSVYSYSYCYIYRPEVIIQDGEMYVHGMDASVPVRRVYPQARGKIVNDFKGASGSSVYEISDGSVWVQSKYKYKYKYAHRPECFVVDDLLYVEGLDEAIPVRRKR